MGKDANIIIGTEIDDSDLDRQLNKVEKKIDSKELELNIGKKDIDEFGKGLESVATEGTENIDDMTAAFSTFGAEAGTTLALVAVAIIAIVAVVAVLAAAFKNLTTENEEMKNQWSEIKNTVSNMIEQINNALAQLLAPVIQWILDTIQKIVQYVGYLLKMWFGIDIFAKSTSKSLKSGVKSAKAMKKQLAGFDEMNVLSDTSSSGGGAGAGTNGNLLKPLGEGEIPNWLKWLGENGSLVEDILLGIATAIGIVMVAMNVANPVGWIMLIIGALGLLVKYWDEIKAFFVTIGKWVYENIISPVVNYVVGLYNQIKSVIDKIVAVVNWVNNTIIKPIVTTIASILSTIYKNIKIVIDNIIQIVKFLWNSVLSVLKPIFTWINNNIIQPVIKAFTTLYNKIKSIFNPIVEFFGKLWEKIKTKLKDWGTKIGEIVGGTFKTVINKVLSTVEKVLNTPIKTINSLISKINEIPGINLTRLNEFKLPRLAKGGIVNMPGRGVPIGGAIAGESGREGVIPLTDSQQMRLLGEAIGRYITINATITNTMNGRVISKEIQRINNDNQFIYNG